MRQQVSVLDWKRFAAEFWEREWLYTDAPPAELDTTSDEVFSAVVAASAVAATPNVHVRFFTEPAPSVQEAERLCPTTEDADFATYERRLDSELAGRPYTLIVNGLQVVSDRLLTSLLEFLAGLHEGLGGIPAGFAELVAVFGRYDASPFGVHRDWASTFMYVLDGAKDAWVSFDRTDDGYPEGHVVAQPGSLTYWPAAAWHLMGSPEASSLSLHVVMGFAADALADVYEAASRRSRIRGPMSHTLPAFHAGRNGTAATIDDIPGTRAARDAFAAALTHEETEQELVERWMQRSSALGVRAFPPPLERVAVTDATMIAASATRPILLAETRPGQLSCCAGGRTFRMPVTDGLIRLVEELRRGYTGLVGPLVRRCALDGLEPEAARRAISTLAAWHVVSRVVH